jgi:HNH endonuclease
MPFSESIKREVKRKAAFRCCRCQAIGVDVHHIIPEKDGGPSDINNAAPLCQNCHDQFGDNPQKQKEITEMRDWWYKKCEKLYSKPGPINEEILSNIDSKLEKIQAGQNENLVELKQLLSGLTYMNIDSIASGSAALIASGIVNTASEIQLNPLYKFRGKKKK